MLYVLSILSILSLTVYGGPADTCDEQANCVDTSSELIEEGDNEGKYTVCLWFDTSKDECDKEGTISHACDGEDEDNKIEGLEEMDTMCQVVDCDDFAYFGLKDGKGCGSETPLFPFAMSGTDPAYCFAGTEGGYCGGGNKKACTWKVPAPSCQETPQLVGDTTEEPQIDTTMYDEEVTCTDLGEDMEACISQTFDCCVGSMGCAEPEECDSCSDVTCSEFGSDEELCEPEGGDECCIYNKPPGDDYGSCQQAVYTAEELRTNNNLKTVTNEPDNSSANISLLVSIIVPISAILLSLL